MAPSLRDRLARQANGEAPSTFRTMFPEEPRLVFVPLTCLEPDPNQPRKNLGDLTELAESIRRNLLEQVLRPGGQDEVHPFLR